MKIANVFLLMASLHLLTIMPIASPQTELPLFDQSYQLSQRLGGDERIFYLIELCHISPRLNAPPEKIQEWANALFNVASTEQNMELHTVGQKNAVSCLSHVNPAAAMDLLTRVDFQRPRAGQWAYEDPRFNAADDAFASWQDKTHNISTIIEKARYLGQTGQYPYWAIANVITHSPPPSKDEINIILNDALSFYTSESGFYNRDEEFLSLLPALNTAAVDNALASRLVGAFVQHLQNDPIHFPGDYYAEVHIPSNGKVFPFTDRNVAFLFQAFPIIRRFTPTIATQLSQQNPQLKQAIGNMRYISGGFLQGDPTSEQAAQKHLQWLQLSLLKRIKECEDSNPQAAAALAQRLTDTTSRIIGFSATVEGMTKTDRAKANTIYEKQLLELTNLSSSIERFRATAALARASYSLGEFKQYGVLSLQAFDMGITLINNDSNAPRIQRHSGFNELEDLTIFAASKAINIFKTGVQQLQDDWLKAYLLLYEAAGHAIPNTPPATSATCPE